MCEQADLKIKIKESIITILHFEMGVAVGGTIQCKINYISLIVHILHSGILFGRLLGTVAVREDL